MAAAIASSSSVLENGFVGDDRYLVVENPVLAKNAPWSDVLAGHWASGSNNGFEKRMNAGYYRPVTTAALRLQKRLFGESPFGYHAVNLGLHVFVCLLVFLLALEIAPLGAAAIAGIAFAIHPVHVEPVAAVSYQTTLLCGLFVFSALLVNAKGRFVRHEFSAREIALPLLYACALGAKEEGIVLLPLLLAYDVAIRREKLSVLFRARYLALAAIALGYLVLRARVAAPQGFTYFQNETAYERIATMVGVAGLYARLLVFPHPLCPFYEWSILPPAHSLLEPFALFGLTASAIYAVALAVAAVLAKKGAAKGMGKGETARFALFALAFVPVSLAPFSHAIPILNAAAERFLYMGSFGYALLLGLAGERLLFGEGRIVRSLAAVSFGAYFLMLGAMSHVRCSDWRSDEALHTATVRDFPESLSAHLALSRLMLESGRYDEALIHAEAARRIAPSLASARELSSEAAARRNSAAGQDSR